MPTYVQDFVDFKEKSNLSVKLGIEIEFFPDELSKTREFIQKYPFDYVMGSVHVIGDWIFDETSEMHECSKRNTWQVYEEYFNLVRSAPVLAFSTFWGIQTLSKSSGQNRRQIFRTFW
jgi:HisJ family histidinol phosphate phosphatase